MRVKLMVCASLVMLSACGQADQTQEAGATPSTVAVESSAAPVPAPVQTASEAAPSEAASASPAPEPTPSASPSPTQAPVAVKVPAPAAKLAEGPPASFARCTACHSVDPGKNKVGPSLAGVFGRKAGAAAGYSYSPALKDSGITWSAASLDEFINAPMKKVPGTKMPIGLPDAKARKDIIDYLASLN